MINIGYGSLLLLLLTDRVNPIIRFFLRRTAPPRAAPRFVQQHFSALLGGFLIFSILISVINFKARIHVMGLSTGVLNGLPYLAWSWTLVNGITILGLYFISWEQLLFGRYTRSFATYLVAILFSTCSRLSRSYIFLALPPFLMLIDWKAKSRRQILGPLISWGLVIAFFTFLNVPIVNQVRLFIFKDYMENTISTTAPLPSPSLPSTESRPPPVDPVIPPPPTAWEKSEKILGLFKNEIFHLAFTRWVGLEGLMTAYGFPEKSWESFKKTSLYSLSDGSISFYDSQIAHSSYNETNNSHVRFGTLPGLFGYLFISGNLLILFFGIFLVGFAGRLMEVILTSMTSNLIFHVYFACFLGLGFAQFGYLPFRFFEHCLSILLFAFVFEKFLRKIE